MENKDFILEQILSIEDFDNVDRKLMDAISENEEYRRIFEEYKEISALASESAPEPVRDGVTLHDAVMERVKNGDVAPRYINTGKLRFPFATVASIVVVIAVAVVLNKGGFLKKASDNSRENIELYDSASEEEAVIPYTDTSFGIMKTSDVNDEDVKSDGSFESGTGAMRASVKHEEETESETADEEAAYLYDRYETETAGDDSDSGDVKQSGTQESLAEAPTGGKSHREQYVNGSEYDTTFASPNVEESITEKAEAEPESKKSVNTHMTADSASYAKDYDSTVEFIYDNEEVISRMNSAEEKGVPEKNLIAVEDIIGLGEDNYISWFDSIKDRSDFTEIYGYEAFVKYCENAE